MRYTCQRERKGEPCVDQGMVYGNHVTWNPDDGLFYVHVGQDELTTRGRFAEWRNAVQYARKHKRE